jgi:hypothetical protein
MNVEDLRRALERLSGDDDEPGIARIARSCIAEGRSAGEAAVALWLETGSLVPRALSVLLALEDLALEPLARSRIPTEPRDRSVRMLAIARAARAAQSRAVNALLAALDDDSDLGAPGGIDESRAPARRVCDEAYLHLRDLFLVDGSAARSARAADAYLSLPQDERDALIREAKESRIFRRLVDDADVEL